MLEVETVATGNVVICRPVGTLDATTVATFRAAVGLCLGDPGLVVDLSDTLFIDNAGLSGLVGALRRAHEFRTQIVVVVPEGPVQRALGDTCLDQIAELTETIELALEVIGDGVSEYVRQMGRCAISPAR